jgi:3-dehydrosphinganine reductase
MGLSVAKQLAAKGANIILVSRSASKLEEALKVVKVRTALLPIDSRPTAT